MTRVCIFCQNNTAKLTLEDVLPMWYLKRRQGLGPLTHVSWRGTSIAHRHKSPREASKFLEKMIDGQPTTLDSDG